jgi:hypothetical protein
VKFEGFFPAHPLQPTQYGILSVARLSELVEKESAKDTEERWVRGYSHIFETNPTIRLLRGSGAVAHEINDATGSPRYIDVKPFFIEVEDYATTMSMGGEDREAKIIRQLEAGTQKSVEHEFYHGYSTRADNSGNQYLTKASTLTIVNNATLYQMQEGLGFLEYAIAQSPLGEQGVIHMTRDMAALLGSQWVLERPDDKGIPHLETTNGTPVCVGSGYDGSGPKAPLFRITVSEEGIMSVVVSKPHGLAVNDKVTFTEVSVPTNPLHTFGLLNDEPYYIVTGTPNANTFTIAVNPMVILPVPTSPRVEGYAFFSPDQDHKWMYATGLVDVNLGTIDIVNTERGHGYNVAGNQNDIRIKAIRPAAVHHEPSVHYGVKVQVHQ